MRGAGFAIATTLTALAGCGLATSGLMGAASDGESMLDGSVSIPGTTDAAASGEDGAATPGNDAGLDVSVPNGSDDDEGGLDSGPIATPDACSEGNDGGPIFTIAAWPRPPPPTIDGDLSEWPCGGRVDFTSVNAAYVKDSAYPISAELAIRWDAMNVYVAVRVSDSSVGGNDAVDPSNNDSVEVYASGDPTLDGDYDANTHQYITDWKGLIVDYGPVHAGAAADGVHAHFVAATKTVPGGWTFEAAIGWQALYAGGNDKFASGSNLALDFEVNDGDGTQQVAALVLTMAPAASSCTCTQANCCCGVTPDVPSCDSQRITRVTLQ